ncbi:uncharacterized protein LOC127249973 [Andrographis paniculata]|uniref:uncharacterized protein LOC127249973 n=1 Tax=Andrographis paniculata TaxID=175694 RepID=UPI0021E743B8|nr:uncharacterized protein LOC127249973 [Andrographis paniculata]
MKPISNQQEIIRYARARDNPYFDGMRRGEAAAMNRGGSTYDTTSARKNVYRSAADRGPRHTNHNIFANEEATADTTPKTSFPDIVLEPIGRSSSGRWSKTSSPIRVLEESDVNSTVNYTDLNEPSPSIVSSTEDDAKQDVISSSTQSVRISSYSVSKRQTDISNVPLPPSAALFYCGASPKMEVVETCESVLKLNTYLKSRKDDVNAGVPGKLLHAVIGPDVSDVGSVASTIAFAFYLDWTNSSSQFCCVPVINMKRADLDSQSDLNWLLHSCRIDLSSLIFIDEIDLSYYDLFGSLNLVLLNCDKIPSQQEALKEAIVEVLHCTKSDATYAWVDSVTARQDGSCCTVIAEKFINTSPEILAGKGFSRLLLAGILLDTANLTNPNCTSKDKYMATLLINGAGRFGCNGLYQILKFKSYDASDNLKVDGILRKEFRKWTRSGRTVSNSLRLSAPCVGMSSIGMSVVQLLAAHDSTSVQEITHFQKSEKLGLLMVVSGYYDSQKKFKREIMVSAESGELLKSLQQFLDSNSSHLLLKPVHQSGLKEETMRVFETDKVTSRRTIERLLEQFLGPLT